MNVTVGKPEKCHLSQVTKVNINSNEAYLYVPLIGCDDHDT